MGTRLVRPSFFGGGRGCAPTETFFCGGAPCYCMKEGVLLLVAVAVITAVFLLLQPTEKVVGIGGEQGAETRLNAPTVPTGENVVVSESEAGGVQATESPERVVSGASPTPELVDLEELPPEERDRIVSAIFDEMAKEVEGWNNAPIEAAPARAVEP